MSLDGRYRVAQALVMTKTLLALTLLVAGCASEPKRLHISPELPGHMHSAFFDAAREWNRAQEEQVVIVSQSPDANWAYNVKLADLSGAFRGAADSKGIKIDPRATEEISWSVIAHEIGHYIGADVHTHGGIMQAVLPLGLEQCIDAEAAALFGGDGTCE